MRVAAFTDRFLRGPFACTIEILATRSALEVGSRYASGMEQLKLVLDAEQARYLNERATELHRTPDELVSSLLTYWLHHAHKPQPLGENESVQDRFARIAEQYVDKSRELFEDDPDLRLDIDVPSGDDDSPPAAKRRSDVDVAPTEGMTEEDVQRAFAEIAEHYTEICREVFGEDPVLSGGVVSERHLYAYGLPIREESRSAGWLSALATRIEQLLSMRPKSSSTQRIHPQTCSWWPTHGRTQR